MKRGASEDDDDVWKNYKLFWSGNGPDPRISGIGYTVYSRDEHQDPHNLFPSTKGEFSASFKTLEAAKKCYERRIKLPTTKECDIQMHMTFGGFWVKFDDVPVPRFSETYIWLVRWRADGAFLESYHLNESKFGERDTDRCTDELSRAEHIPGLRSYYVDKKNKNE